MGMQTMQTQQPMRQSMGKGMGQQSPTIVAAPEQSAGFGDFENDQMRNHLGPQETLPSQRGAPREMSDYSKNNMQFMMGGNYPGSNQSNSYPNQFARPTPSDGYRSQMTYSGQNGQPRFGQPNSYSNTVNPWDNATIAPQYSSGKGGKTGQPATQQPTGKSGGQASNYPTARTNFTYNPVTTPLQNNAATQVTTGQNTQQTTVPGNSIPGMYGY